MKQAIRRRLNLWAEEPLYWTHINAIDQRLQASTLPPALLELIRVRVSQINQCVFCIDYHSQEAMQRGESPRRLIALNAWRESPLFSAPEKAALQAAEDLTLVHRQGLSDWAYAALQSHFSRAEIADLIVCISHINFLNRVGVPTATIPAD